MDKSLEKQLIAWLKKQKNACGFYLNLTVLFGLLTGIALILQTYLLSTILHGIIIDELPKSTFNNNFIMLLLLIPVRALLAFSRERSSFEAGKRLRLQVRKAVLDKLTELGPVFIKGKPAGSWASIVLEQIEDLQDFYARYLPQMLLAGFIPLCILIVVFPLNWAAGLILLTTAPLIPLFMILVGMGAADANRKNFSALAQLSGHFMDRLKGLKTLKLFNRGEAEINAIESASESFRQRTMEVLRLAFLSSAVLEFFGAISIAILAIYFGFSFLDHLNFGNYGERISLFTGLFILMLAPEFYQPLRDMGTHYHAKAQAIGAAESLKTLLDYHVKTQSSKTLKSVDWQQPIELKATEFSVYSLDGTELAGPLTFTLKKDEQIALVGPSGSGKTSLLNALLGFLPYQGSLTINGVELNQIDKTQWRQQLAWLGQDPHLFHGTVAENVTMGNDALSTKSIEDCLQKAAILDFVNQQPLGLNHPIGEQMAGLSVGQAQRFALARALAQDAQLFLLDEPTASLDQHSEQVIFNTLHHATTLTASLMITHRLEKLKKMHNILVLDKGLIVQQGSFSELNQQDGLFKQMLYDEHCIQSSGQSSVKSNAQKNEAEELR
ncbi:MAG TPA: cysteine/glutathione ABC transporter permease/ATP-binding protein CydD [Psychromonas hadalis]|nr:cysteine/glutathione ABC transporter permease/ATP-binding protein CydD [Psychromonas hadalis]